MKKLYEINYPDPYFARNNTAKRFAKEILSRWFYNTKREYQKAK